MPALTLNTSISSSMSSSVSMSSRGSTMTFCTVPRSARHQSAQVLSATPGHPCPPCWGCGEEGSPRPVPISLLLWQAAVSQLRSPPEPRHCHHPGQHGDMQQGKGSTRTHHGGSGMHIKSRGSTGVGDSDPRMGTEVWEGQGWMSVPLGWVTGQERLDDDGPSMGNRKHIGWVLGTGKDEAG